jgi:dipeptidyl-peptidase-4
MLIRDIAYNKIDGVLDNQTILIIPIFNPDGNEKLGNNRRDNGPELAGTRFNGQFLDLNRDFTKLESPEVSALIRVFNEWNPVLFVDMHTTNGSYHREPVTYTTLNNPNTDQRLKDYMWNKFFPTVSKRLKYKYGYDSLPYGNFVDRANPELGWYNHAFEARYGTIYAGLRSILTVLNENYAHADFKTRVLSSLGFIKSILHYSDKHIKEMQKLVQTAELNTIRNYYKEKFILEYKNEKLFDVTIKSYVFKKEKIKPEDRHKYPPWIKEYIVQKTDKLKDYTVPYFTNPIPTRSVSLPGGYILLPNHSQVVNTLKNHGIIVEKIRKKIPVSAENFVIKELKLGKRLYQGHVLLEPKGEYAQKNVDIPAGSYYISMKQPLARIIAVLLEPESTDSLISWGFFNREIVTQWSNKPKEYPVYRIGEQTELSLERIQY